MSMAEDSTSTPYDDVLFSVRRSVRYHKKRERHFATIDSVLTTSLLLSGLVTLTVVLGPFDNAHVTSLAGIITLASVLQVVFKPHDKASGHAELANRFSSLEHDLVVVGPEIDKAKVRLFGARRIQIEADERPKLEIVDLMAHNDLVRAMGYRKDDGQFVEIPPCMRFWAHYANWGAHKLQKDCDK